MGEEDVTEDTDGARYAITEAEIDEVLHEDPKESTEEEESSDEE